MGTQNFTKESYRVRTELQKIRGNHIRFVMETGHKGPQYSLRLHRILLSNEVN